MSSRHSSGKPGEGNDVRDDDVADENVRLSKREKLGPEGGNEYTKVLRAR